MIEIVARKLMAHTFRHDPQRRGEAGQALDLVYDGLQTLARLGFPMTLEPGSGYVPVLWPRMYYHQVFGERIFHSPEELAKSGPHWHDVPLVPYMPPGIDDIKAAAKSKEQENGRLQK